MARTYPLYLSTSTTKYSFFKYGDSWKYGWNYPPPVPTDLTIQGSLTYIDGVPNISWNNPTFAWSAAVPEDDSLLYDLEISYNDSSFTTLEVDTGDFSSDNKTYTLPPGSVLLKEGTYYARVRSTDGFTYSSWSSSFRFVLFIFSAYPPTIDTVTSPADSFWQVITGTKYANQYVFLRNNNGAWSEVQYPYGINSSRWQLNIQLTNGNNHIEAVSSTVANTSGKLSRPVFADIYLIVSTPEVYNVWNHFDEFGLLLGLPRIPGEKNRDYKERLLDVYAHPANSTYDGLKYGISRELGLGYSDITVEKLSDLMDPTYAGNLLNEDNNALGTKLVDYADEVYDHNPIFFGNIINDESYWDGVDEDTNGYLYLPHQWDPTVSGVYEKWLTSGIGDNDDLWVNDPIEIWNPGISGYSWYLPIHTGYFYSVYPSGVLGV